MKTLRNILILFILTLFSSGLFAVDYSINLYDSNGDGWKTTSGVWDEFIRIYVNGSYAGDIRDTGASSIITLTVLDGDEIVFLYKASGTDDSQNSFEVLDPWNNVVASGGNSMPSSNTYVAVFSIHDSQPSATASQGEDCGWATTVCNDATVAGNASGPGNRYELDLTNEGCLYDEHQTSWYFFHAQTTGTIELNINPAAADDYDFAIWTTSNCPPTATPLRCSWAAGTGSTGLVTGSGDNSEDAGGDSWVESINVTAGDEFLVLVDNWSASSNPYTLEWTLTNGASLDCTPLPVSLSSFTGKADIKSNLLEWTTLTEINNDYFIIESSTDGISFNEIGSVKGKGNSNVSVDYTFIHGNIENSTYYYRLIQVDLNGEIILSDIIKINGTEKINLDVYPNPSKGEINIEANNLQKIIIRNINGELIDEVSTNDNLYKYNFKNKTGLYFITVVSNDFIETRKVVVSWR